MTSAGRSPRGTPACDVQDWAVAGVQGLKPYQPGKPISELEREYGVSDVLKLASNENPLGASPLAVAAMRLEITKYTNPVLLCCWDSNVWL